jgi:hypothetical protein
LRDHAADGSVTFAIDEHKIGRDLPTRQLLSFAAAGAAPGDERGALWSGDGRALRSSCSSSSIETKASDCVFRVEF